MGILVRDSCRRSNDLKAKIHGFVICRGYLFLLKLRNFFYQHETLLRKQFSWKKTISINQKVSLDDKMAGKFSLKKRKLPEIRKKVLEVQMIRIEVKLATLLYPKSRQENFHG